MSSLLCNAVIKSFQPKAGNFQGKIPSFGLAEVPKSGDGHFVKHLLRFVITGVKAELTHRY
jgi:hypothetical protein